MGNTLRIAVEAKEGTIFDAEYLDTVRKINDELFLLPGVDRPYMKSLWTPAVRWTGVTEDGLDGGPVVPDDYDGSAESLDQVRRNVERSGEIGQLVAANYKSSIVLVPLQETIAETGARIDYAQLSERIEALRAKYESDRVGIHVTGFAKVVGDLLAGLQQVMVFFAIAIGICTAVLYWYTRCLRSTLLVVLCSMIAVVWLLGLLPTLGYELDSYSVLVPFLVFAIDNDFRGHKAYLCGPPLMIDACITTLMQGRLFERDIYTEKFISAADAQQVRSPLFKAI